jgi:hypothetical protein
MINCQPGVRLSSHAQGAKAIKLFQGLDIDELSSDKRLMDAVKHIRRNYYAHFQSDGSLPGPMHILDCSL